MSVLLRPEYASPPRTYPCAISTLRYKAVENLANGSVLHLEWGNAEIRIPARVIANDCGAVGIQYPVKSAQQFEAGGL